ncbi:MAG: methionine--tRNA ligase subunit beta, partial [Lachnospiraceae bacterium]|nr:methionine--tRNA ligase subunit beta [Lachnospiraceae bacterium]
VAEALSEIFGLFKRCNKYIDETEPWVLARDEAKKERLSVVLYNLVESIVMGASILEPFMPDTAKKIAEQLMAPLRDFSDLSKFGLYKSGTRVTGQPEILFARLDVKEVIEKVAAMFAARSETIATDDGDKNSQSSNANSNIDIADGGAEDNVIDIEAKPEITYDDFARLQFQVGEIIACEEVPKSKKLLCSQVRVGHKIRQIVSGIKQSYTASEMVGKKVMVLVNLKPATLAGVLSEGMLLCAEDQEGRLVLMTPEQVMPAGAEIS